MPFKKQYKLTMVVWVLGETVLVLQHLRFVELEKQAFVGILMKWLFDTTALWKRFWKKEKILSMVCQLMQ